MSFDFSGSLNNGSMQYGSDYKHARPDTYQSEEQKNNNYSLIYSNAYKTENILAKPKIVENHKLNIIA